MKLICPICQDQILAAHELSADLVSQKCNVCGGQWISSFEFWKWLQSPRLNRREVQSYPMTASSSESRTARICPECGDILVKYRVGHSLGFSLDRCRNCGGTWFDREEWEILQSGELRDEVHPIFSAAWQQQIRKEDRARHLQKLFTKKVGEEDFAEIKRVKDWLDQHPLRFELRAFLDSDVF